MLGIKWVCGNKGKSMKIGKISNGAIFIICVFVLLIIYAAKIEPYWIEVREQPVYISELPEAFEEFRIIQLSDLHGKTFRDKEIALRVNKLNPDLVVITGDIFDQSSGVPLGYADTVFDGMSAKYGIYFVFGNNDRYLGEQRVIEKLDQIKIRTLVNNTVRITLKNSGIDLVGIDDPYSQNADLLKALKGTSPGPKILLAHTPEIINEALKNRIDLTLAGHTHGGQIYIPFMPRFSNVSKGYEKYISGMHNVGNTQMYVNRGLGENYINMRFLTRPEITVIILYKKT